MESFEVEFKNRISGTITCRTTHAAVYISSILQFHFHLSFVTCTFQQRQTTLLGAQRPVSTSGFCLAARSLGRLLARS
jgi:hypothetical protein